MIINAQKRSHLKKKIAQLLQQDVQREVIIQSASVLDDAQRKALLEALPGLQSANVTYESNPELLGGLIIRDGSKLIDMSLKGSLSTIMQSLI